MRTMLSHTTARTPSRPAPAKARRWRVEVLLFLVALVAYQASRVIVVGDAGDAVRNAWGIIDFEKGFGLFFESSVQAWMLDNMHVTQVLNYFYVWAHLPVTALFFIWLYNRRNHHYTFVRNAFFLANAVALTVYVVFPVAPPRMITSEGFIDTLSIISGIDLHGGNLSNWFNPFAAVPSMHFGYAIMIGVVAALLIRNWPMRLLVLTYPAIVFFTIVGTANHYVVDALAGAAVMGISFAVVAIVRSRPRRVAVPPDTPDGADPA